MASAWARSGMRSRAGWGWARGFAGVLCLRWRGDTAKFYIGWGWDCGRPCLATENKFRVGDLGVSFGIRDGAHMPIRIKGVAIVIVPVAEPTGHAVDVFIP